ncbi:MAG: 3-hydroxyacyl-CoA dehydrogenase NAD-binding domain-containing protein [Chitinophagaceae bacterium]
MTIQSICICGAGTMGSGIAQVSAQAGFHTILFDLNAEVLSRAQASVERNLQALVDRKKLDATEQAVINSRIVYTRDLQACLADLFIEAIVEKEEVKVGLFNQLAELNHSECIFASNTSSLSITSIARQVVNPARVIGLHFFNPAPLMKLVEVVNTPFTHPEVTATIVELARQMGKTPVTCQDAPGFIVNRVARPYYIESLRLAEEKLSDYAQLDKLLTATGFKMGPFQLMDLIGNDVNYAVSTSVYEQLGQPERLKPSYLQKDKVDQGKLGRKSGEGYYNYTDTPPKSAN